MNKNEILEKAQNAKPNTPDEMELQIVQKGSAIALFCIIVFSLILMIAKMSAGQPWYDVYSLMFVSMAAQHLYKGIKLHQNHELVIGIISSILAIVGLVFFLIEILG